MMKTINNWTTITHPAACTTSVLPKRLASLYATPTQSTCTPYSFLSCPNTQPSLSMKGLLTPRSLYNASSLFLSTPKLLPPNFHNNNTLLIPMTACIDTSQNNPISQDKDTQYSFMKFCRAPIPQSRTKTTQTRRVTDDPDPEDQQKQHPNPDSIWLQMQDEARSDIAQEPILSSYYYTSILHHSCLETALAHHLAVKLSNPSLSCSTLVDIFTGVFLEDGEVIRAVKEDLRAVKERDPACISYAQCFLNFKGFLACQAHRVAHNLWSQGRKVLALLIQNRVSEVFAVDIHPGAKMGHGILLDHATGVVVGETAVIGNNVSILHNVTLGGTGKMCGDRHPKIGDGVLIGAGTCILGNIRIGEGAKIGACSVVLKDVPARTTAVGNPARLIGGKENPKKLEKMASFTMDHTSHISEWSDYVI